MNLLSHEREFLKKWIDARREGGWGAGWKKGRDSEVLIGNYRIALGMESTA